MNHSKEEEEEEENDGLLVEIPKQLMTSWQQSFLISEVYYFPDKVAVLSTVDHYMDNVVSYVCDLCNMVQKKQLTMDQLIVKGQKRKASDASQSTNSKRVAINERDRDDDDDDTQQLPTPQ